MHDEVLSTEAKITCVDTMFEHQLEFKIGKVAHLE